VLPLLHYSVGVNAAHADTSQRTELTEMIYYCCCICLLCSESEGHQYVPRMLDALAAVFITQISACGFHSGALSSGGEVSTATTANNTSY
jgi:hypothetical protein